LNVRLLGPVEVVSDGQLLDLGAKKQRALLAMLALDPNRPVAIDRIIDGLWGEEPPPSAAKLVQVYVSGLRKVLRGSAVEIVTHGRGYELRCDAGAVDVTRMERLLSAGSDENGHAREALALWRGSPLVDVADEPFAAAEIRRLEELRFQAQEAAIAADIAAGHSDEVLAELSVLVAEHPLREQLQVSWMLALYQSGRQAEALEAYRVARAALVEQIGAEPGPELRRAHEAILRHDPDIAGPVRRPAAIPRSRRRWLVLAGAGLALIAAVIVVLSRHEETAALAEDWVGLVTANGTVRESYPVGRRPVAVVSFADSLWVANELDGTVTRIERDEARETAIDVGDNPTALAAGAGSVWVANGESRTVSQIDPTSNKIIQRVEVAGQPTSIAVGADAVWVAMPLEGEIARIALNGEQRRAALGGAPSAVAVGAGGVWVADRNDARVLRIDPRTLVPTKAIDVGSGPSSIAVGAGAIWVANRPDGTVSRIDPETMKVTDTATVGTEAAAVAAGDDAVWVADGAGARLARLDPAGRLTDTIKSATSPSALSVDGGAVWVTALPGPPSHRGGTLRVETQPCAYENRCADPAFAHPSGWDLLTLAYDGLVAYRRAAYGAGDVLVGALATDVPEPTDGGRRYVFLLRAGLRYSDGQPVRASDFGPSLERALRLNAALNPDYYTAIVGVPACLRRPARCDLSRGITADDSARTVTIQLSRPDPDLPYKLALPQASLLPSGGPGEPAEGVAIPGTGPYRIAGAITGSGSAQLVRNPYFTARPATDRPAGFADEIVFERTATLGQRIDAVEHDDADLVTVDRSGRQMSPALLQGLVTAHPGHVTVSAQLGVDTMFLNVRAPPFDDVRVRHAVNLAADRTRMAATFGGPIGAEPACQVVPSTLPGYSPRCPFTRSPNPGGVWAGPDLPAARRLIAESGTAGARITVWVDGTKPELGRYWTALLDRLGYQASLRVMRNVLKYYDTIGDPNKATQTGWYGWVADYPTPTSFIDPVYTCPRPGGDLYPPRLCDRRLDRQVREALRAGGTATAWRPAERRLVRLAPAVPFATRRDVFLTSTRTGNVQQHPMWGPLLERAWVR
jgi:peptide/nickel transport system substrate-binding protein